MDGKNYPYKPKELDGISRIFTAEFDALRRELEYNAEHQKDIMNFSILTFTAMIGLLGFFEAANRLEPFLFVYLLFPWIFFLLLLLYADKTVRILRVADYIQNHLRKRIIKICGENFWQWELYKMHESYPLTSRRLALLLDRTRWLIFVFPSLLSIVLFFLLSYIIKDFDSLSDIMSLFDNEGIILLLVVDIIAISFLCIWIIPLLEETMGVETRREVFDLDALENSKHEKIITRTITRKFEDIPRSKRNTLLEKLSEKDRASWDVALALAEHYDELPRNVRNVLFKLAEKDETAGAVADAVAKHFKKLPKTVRNELLLKLAEKDETAGAVADAVAKHFRELPKTVRNELLLKLAGKDESS